MENTKNSATASQTKPIVIKRTFNLPPETVWKAFSDAGTMKKWWGPNGFTCPDCTIDFRTGGKYLASMQDKDGSKTWSTGTIKEIVQNRKIVYTDSFSDEKGNVKNASELGMPGNWPMEMQFTVEMNENNGKTELTLTLLGIPSEMYDDCIQGWQQSLDKLERIES